MTSDKKEKEKQITKEIQLGLAALGKRASNIWGEEDNDAPDDATRNVFPETDFGICATCQYFFGQRSVWGKYYVHCDYLNKPLAINAADPVAHCTNYSRRGQMTIADMQQIATIIDLDKKDKIGLL